MKRTEKIALLSSLMSGTATPKQRETLRKSREPIHVTLILDATNREPVYPIYCIHVANGKSRCYWRYEDGRTEDVSSKPV